MKTKFRWKNKILTKKNIMNCDFNPQNVGNLF